MEVINAIGRRKTSVARIYLQEGQGNITVNSKELATYFPSEILRTIVNQPLAICNQAGKYDIKVNVVGGGITGQAEAIRLAISRALLDAVSKDAEDEERKERKVLLKQEGLTTRDPRMVERKKYGRRKARRRFQFSKR
jgi:small subunit ribosomal protein S9